MIELAPRDNPAVGVEIAPFNWALRRAREKRGWSRAALARQAGVPAGDVGLAEKLHPVSAVYRERLSLALGVPEDVLFPGSVDAALLATDHADDPQIDLTEARRLLDLHRADQSAAALKQADLAASLTGLLDTMPPRLARVLQLRYGLHSGPPATLAYIAEQFGVSVQRIRDLEARALRDLRRTDIRRVLYPSTADAAPRAVQTPVRHTPKPVRAAPAPKPAQPRPVSQVRPSIAPPAPAVARTDPPYYRWLRHCAAGQHGIDARIRDIARAVVDSPCCRVFDDPVRLRPHVAAEHITNPDFWPLYDEFCRHFERWFETRKGG